ncbi:MAG: hypothetical protein QM564_01535 [Bergeyella sp.]
MKKTHLLLFALLLLFASCKKDKVDASSTGAFQSSINDMASGLTTIKQIKFNEALYILKTFGVEADGDANELKALAKLLEGKKVPEIFALADQVAQKNGIEWSSTGSPSLGEMNIFDEITAKESNPNDVKANSLSILTRNTSADSISGVKAIQIIPRLVDRSDNPIIFQGAGLETILEVRSNGVKLLTSKNLMQDNNFKGFNLKFSSLPADKVTDNKIDITVTVKTTEKTYKMSKIGIAVNPKALYVPKPETPQSDIENPEMKVDNPSGTTEPVTGTSAPAAKDPKTTVTKFLNNLSSRNLKDAYESSANPNWGSYDNFSNPVSGFGAVKSLSVKNISTKNTSDNAATVNATYDVTDKNGQTTPLSVTFGLKNVNGEWKISSYKINP